jgi:hypothetical protein
MKTKKKEENLKDVKLAQTNVKISQFQQSVIYNKWVVIMGGVGRL